MRALILAPFAGAALTRLRRSMDVLYESWLDSGRLYDPDLLGVRIATEDIAVLVVEADFVFAELFAAAPCLRLVGVCRNALNHVDLEAASEHGVLVTHTRGRNTTAVAEMTLGCMLALCRRIVPAHGFVTGGGWRDPAAGYRMFQGREIHSSTVGIIGFGQIGREVAVRCLALGAAVLVYDPLVPPGAIGASGAEAVSLAELAERSDIVSLHVSADVTERVVDRMFLDGMKRGAYLINTSVGAAVDAEALGEALRDGHIAGAALDVFDGQPLPLASALLSTPNLLLTPHIAGATIETVERQSSVMVAEIERFLRGEVLHHAVNAAAVTARAR